MRLAELISANKTVGGCYCTWFMRDEWGAGNKNFLHDRVRAGEQLGVLAIDDDDRPVGWVAVAPRATALVDYARARGARAVEGHPVDTDGQKKAAGDLFHGTLDMFLSAGFTLVERRGTRRALVRRELP